MNTIELKYLSREELINKINKLKEENKENEEAVYYW